MRNGDTYRERLRRWMPCPDCKVEFTVGSITSHRRRLHGTESTIDWEKLPFIQTEHLPQVFEFSFPRVTNKFQ